jgi:ketosteroid isomerase-like protein
MSQENVEVARRAWRAFNERDLPALADFSDEDLEFVSVLSAVDESSYRGKDTWATYLAAMDQTWADWRSEDLRIFDGDGDRVAAVFRMVGTGKASGVPVEREVGMAYTMRQGKL